jgi:hypothetical protein
MRPQAVEAGVFVPLPLAGAVHQLLAYGLDELRRRDGVRPHAVVVELVEMFGAARRAVEEASAADVPPVDVTPYRRRTMACSGSPGRCVSVGQYAARDGVTPRAIVARIARGTLPAHRVGNVWHVEVDEESTT